MTASDATDRATNRAASGPDNVRLLFDRVGRTLRIGGRAQ